jgi:hypothetical protein
MNALRITAVAAALLTPAPALALSFEAFGNAPVENRPGWAQGLVEAVNLDSRLYSLWAGEGAVPTYFYRGNARALNEALGKFAAVKARHRHLLLLPGRGKTHSFAGERIDFDWRLHLSFEGSVVMTAYVTGADRAGPGQREDRAGAGGLAR